MKSKILNRRGTLFCGEQNKVDVTNYMVFIDALKGLNVLPSVNKGIGFNVKPDGSISQEEVLSLDFSGSDDSTFKISFGPGRIDISSSDPEITIDCFMGKMKKVVNALKDIYNEGYIRYALCATIMFEMDDDNLDKAYNRFVKNDKGESPIEWSIRKVLRTTLTDAEYSVDVNNVYTISRGIYPRPNMPPIGALILEQDINTVVGADINSLSYLQKRFFAGAAKTLEESLEEYINIFTNERGVIQ